MYIKCKECGGGVKLDLSCLKLEAIFTITEEGLLPSKVVVTDIDETSIKFLCRECGTIPQSQVVGTCFKCGKELPITEMVMGKIMPGYYCPECDKEGEKLKLNRFDSSFKYLIRR